MIAQMTQSACLNIKAFWASTRRLSLIIDMSINPIIDVDMLSKANGCIHYFNIS